MIRVLITGAGGRTGREVVRTVSSDPGMVVAACVDTGTPGDSVDDGLGGAHVCSGNLAEAILATSPDVMVDFTRPDAVAANVRIALAAGVDCVVGTTGLEEDELASLAAMAAPGTCLFWAPNFAIGAVLMIRFACEAAKHMPHAEIIELHHDAKLDAPSGTALRTAGMIASARSESPAVPGPFTGPGASARGATVDDVPVHSVRLPGLVAHQEVVFGGQGQTLTIRHDSIDRTSFMPGVLLAVRRVGAMEGLVIGLDRLLEDRE